MQNFIAKCKSLTQLGNAQVNNEMVYKGVTQRSLIREQKLINQKLKMPKANTAAIQGAEGKAISSSILARNPT